MTQLTITETTRDHTDTITGGHTVTVTATIYAVTAISGDTATTTSNF
jgi:hypothetical protein